MALFSNFIAFFILQVAANLFFQPESHGESVSQGL